MKTSTIEREDKLTQQNLRQTQTIVVTGAKIADAFRPKPPTPNHLRFRTQSTTNGPKPPDLIEWSKRETELNCWRLLGKTPLDPKHRRYRSQNRQHLQSKTSDLPLPQKKPRLKNMYYHLGCRRTGCLESPENSVLFVSGGSSE
jgi:hypothetical protein